MSERRRWSPVPRSLLGRMLLLTLLAVLVAQGLSSLFWLSHLRSSQREGLLTSSRSLAYSMAASVSYFRSLPLGYRPLVLDQLRSIWRNAAPANWWRWRAPSTPCTSASTVT